MCTAIPAVLLDGGSWGGNSFKPAPKNAVFSALYAADCGASVMTQDNPGLVCAGVNVKLATLTGVPEEAPSKSSRTVVIYTRNSFACDNGLPVTRKEFSGDDRTTCCTTPLVSPPL